jgi:6-phosphogluconolactonase
MVGKLQGTLGRPFGYAHNLAQDLRQGDGHTASLLPGEPVLEERQRWVAAVSHGRPETRITMTYPAIESSRRVAFLVTGREKAPILRAIRAGSSEAPASRVRPVGELIWFVDQAAASAE